MYWKEIKLVTPKYTQISVAEIMHFYQKKKPAKMKADVFERILGDTCICCLSDWLDNAASAASWIILYPEFHARLALHLYQRLGRH